MAGKNCIASLVDAEESIERLLTLMRVMHEACPEGAPDWVALVWPMVQEIELASAALGRLVRGEAC